MKDRTGLYLYCIFNIFIVTFVRYCCWSLCLGKSCYSKVRIFFIPFEKIDFRPLQSEVVEVINE